MASRTLFPMTGMESDDAAATVIRFRMVSSLWFCSIKLAILLTDTTSSPNSSRLPSSGTLTLKLPPSKLFTAFDRATMGSTSILAAAHMITNSAQIRMKRPTTSMVSRALLIFLKAMASGIS